VIRAGNEYVTSWYHEGAANICIFEKGELHSLTCGISKALHFCDFIYFGGHAGCDVNSRI